MHSVRGYMKKFLYFLLVIFTVLLLAAGGIFIYLVTYFDDIIKDRAEAIVPEMTKTHFEIDKIETFPLKGKFEIFDLYLGNPEGFPEGHTLKFDRVLVHIDWKSLSRNKIIIKSLIIDGLDVYLIKEGDDKSNLKVILENIDSYMDELNKSQELVDIEDIQSTAKKTLPEMRFQVNLFEINDGQVLVHTDKVIAVSAEAEIPQAKLEYLGKEGKGLTIEQLIKEIVKEVIKEVDLAVNIGKKAREDIESGEAPDEEQKGEGLGKVIQELIKKKAK
jgi:uncharacterized protein involved in outer membrane biogenesis